MDLVCQALTYIPFKCSWLTIWGMQGNRSTFTFGIIIDSRSRITIPVLILLSTHTVITVIQYLNYIFRRFPFLYAIIPYRMFTYFIGTAQLPLRRSIFRSGHDSIPIFIKFRRFSTKHYILTYQLTYCNSILLFLFCRCFRNRKRGSTFTALLFIRDRFRLGSV